MRFLTVEQVAEILQLSRSKVYDLVAVGDIVPHRIGHKRTIRIGESDLHSYLAACREEKAEKPAKAPRLRLKHLSR